MLGGKVFTGKCGLNRKAHCRQRNKFPALLTIHGSEEHPGGNRKPDYFGLGFPFASSLTKEH